MTNILDTVEPDWWDEQGAGPFYSRETVESLLEAHRKQVLLEAAEEFSALKAGYTEWVSDELRRMAKGERHE
jgi:hypothetical protein